MGNFGGLTAFYVRLLASRCMPAEPASADGVQVMGPKLCNYCGVVVDSGMVCTTDGEFNHCQNKQIGEAIGGVVVDHHQGPKPSDADASKDRP